MVHSVTEHFSFHLYTSSGHFENGHEAIACLHARLYLTVSFCSRTCNFLWPNSMRNLVLPNMKYAVTSPGVGLLNFELGTDVRPEVSTTPYN